MSPMSERKDFRLDTSGEITVSVDDATHLDHVGSYVWSDLTPFAQGYVEAMLRDASAVEKRGEVYQCPSALKFSALIRPYAFSDLAPEALARIIADCEARLRHRPSLGETNPYMGPTPHQQLLNSGARFWRERQGGGCKNFPPLTVTLGDDGKVRL